MILRDKMKDEIYFENYIQLIDKLVRENKLELYRNEIPVDNVENVKTFNCLLSSILLKSKYSAGYDLALIADDYVKLITDLTGPFSDAYSDVLPLIAKGVMLDFPENTREILNNIVSDKYKNDFLSNFF